MTCLARSLRTMQPLACYEDPDWPCHCKTSVSPLKQATQAAAMDSASEIIDSSWLQHLCVLISGIANCFKESLIFIFYLILHII